MSSLKRLINLKKLYPKKINNEENILDVARKSKTVLKIENTKQNIFLASQEA